MRLGKILAAALTLGALTSLAVTSPALAAEAQEGSAEREKVKSVTELKLPIGRTLSRTGFQGESYRNDLIPATNEFGFPETNNITFGPSARGGWHAHGAMVVIAIEGVGYYQAAGEQIQRLHAGDVVYIPAGLRHWHGASPDSYFSQIVIYDRYYEGSKVFGAVSDAEYLAPAVDYQAPAAK